MARRTPARRSEKGKRRNDITFRKDPDGNLVLPSPDESAKDSSLDSSLS
jgi:hypothetical protein